MQLLKTFIPANDIAQDEWVLDHQKATLFTISVWFGMGVLPFSFVRFMEGNYIVGFSQAFLGLFLFYGAYRLRKDRSFYHLYAFLFLIFFYLYTMIIFFYVPQNHLNILWVVSAPILIFFFLSKRVGTVMFFLILSFIIYLFVSGYEYTLAEYITLVAAFFITTYVMNAYEYIKTKQTEKLTQYNQTLEREVKEKTKMLEEANSELEDRVNEEVHKRMEQEHILLRQARMASMGEMIDAIAHQWRQPLMNISAVMMNIDRGIETDKSKEELKEKVLEVFALTSHMSHTIEDFRNLLQSEKEKGLFSINEVVENVRALLKNNLKNIEVTFHANEKVMLESFKSEFSQVLITLLSNASEVLHMRNIKNKRIVIRVLQNERDTMVSVEDNAGGIKQENLSKIFDPYFTTKKQIGGTGLGLYIANIIVVHNMRGKLEVSNTAEGAKFMMSIPKGE